MPENPTRVEVEAFIRSLCELENLPDDVVIRQCEAESAFRQYDSAGKILTSECGALGLMQLMPRTASGLSVNPHDWRDNLRGGVRYLAQMLRFSRGNMAQALACYNWGPGNMARTLQRYGEAWREHLPQETRNYLRKILEED